MGDVFQCVFNRVRKGVHGVDAPRVTGVVVTGMFDAVDGRVTQVDVGAAHADFGAQHRSTIGQKTRAHVSKTLEVVLGGA